MSKGIRRINFYAGPGAGKSTISARVFAELKIRGYDVEHIPEYVKVWAHEKRVPSSYDQLYIFAKQVKSEDVILRNVRLIVTDSPIMMNAAYSMFYGFKSVRHLIGVAQDFDRDFRPLNFFIDRTVTYNDKGRYQNFDQAVEFDNFLMGFLADNLCGDLRHIKVENFGSIMQTIQEAVGDSDT